MARIHSVISRIVESFSLEKNNGNSFSFNAPVSVIRRATALLCLVAPGFLLNFALLVVAASYLPKSDFGILYISISLITVLSAPSIILSFYYSRYFALIHNDQGEASSWNAYPGVAANVAAIGAAIGILAAIGLSSLGVLLGIKSHILAIAIGLALITNYLADTPRSFLQGIHHVIWLGLYTSSWMLLRFLLCLGGLLALERVWAGIGGIMLAGLLMAAGVALVVRKKMTAASKAGMPPLKGLIPFTAGFLVLMAIGFIDVLLGYVLFDDKSNLGVYSASSVLPKALITLTLPILQVSFPVVVRNYQIKAQQRNATIRSVLFTLLIASSGALFVFILGNLFCGEAGLVKGCQTNLMSDLLIAGVSVCVLRALALSRMAFAGSLDIALLILALLAFVGHSIVQDVSTPLSMARNYKAFSIFVMIGYLVLLALHLMKRPSEA